MTEEKKECCPVSGKCGGLGKLIVGILLIVGGGYLCWLWCPALFTVVKGCLGPFLVLLGLIFVAIAKE